MAEAKCKRVDFSILMESPYSNLGEQKPFFVHKKGIYGIEEEYAGWTPFIESHATISRPSLEIEFEEKIDLLLETMNELLNSLREKPISNNTFLRDLNSNKYTLKEKIEIIIEEYPNETIAKWPELEVFGQGASLSEAILDLKREIADIYEDLSNTGEKELGKIPRMWLRILKKLIMKI